MRYFTYTRYHSHTYLLSLEITILRRIHDNNVNRELWEELI